MCDFSKILEKRDHRLIAQGVGDAEPLRPVTLHKNLMSMLITYS